MNNTIKFYLVLLILIFAGITYIEVHRPKPIDWKQYYSIDKKTPFGLYILNQEIDSIFGKGRIKRLNKTPYEFFDQYYDYDSLVQDYSIKGTFLTIDNESRMDEESISEILTFVSRGNEAFISMNSFPSTLIDSLKFTTSSQYLTNDTAEARLSYIDSQRYRFTKSNYLNYFDSIDSIHTEILGYYHQKDSSKKDYPNFIRIAYNKGIIFLHTMPMAFTNYQLLKGNNYQYTEQLLSYIQPQDSIYWYTNKALRDEKADTPLRVILSYPSLRWAWYFFLIGFIIYLIFNAKRRQRIVPIIKPLENTTVEFTKTISNLYYQENNYMNILEKRIIYFLERVRSEYHLDTQNINDNFIHKLSLKSGKKIELIKQIVYIIRNKRKARYSSEDDLITLNNLLEKFWN